MHGELVRDDAGELLRGEALGLHGLLEGLAGLHRLANLGDGGVGRLGDLLRGLGRAKLGLDLRLDLLDRHRAGRRGLGEADDDELVTAGVDDVAHRLLLCEGEGRRSDGGDEGRVGRAVRSLIALELRDGLDLQTTGLGEVGKGAGLGLAGEFVREISTSSAERRAFRHPSAASHLRVSEEGIPRTRPSASPE